MKIAIINKSDSTGGAAVVSFRLMEALRRAGADARMVVMEKRTDSPYVSLAATGAKSRIPFLKERLKIFVENGFNRDTLFKIDTGSDGLDLLKDPVVKDADVLLINWVNQGMLSLEGVRRLSEAGKKIIWTMHDMWCYTGVCHHSGECERYEHTCYPCPLLKKAMFPSLAERVQKKKKRVYGVSDIHFVAVSNWLADRAQRSSLFGGKRPTVIPNAFPFDNQQYIPSKTRNKGGEDKEFRILFGAARLDDSVKGLPILIEATRILAERWSGQASKMRLVTFGDAKNPEALDGIAIAHTHLGRISGKENLRKVYEESDAVVSTSLYETLPGTLVEGQAYGCVPVAFLRGGQGDIIDHRQTGYLAEWSDDFKEGALHIAEGLIWAMENVDEDMRREMFNSAYNRFSEDKIAARYLELICPDKS